MFRIMWVFLVAVSKTFFIEIILLVAAIIIDAFIDNNFFLALWFLGLGISAPVLFLLSLLSGIRYQRI